MPSQRTSHQRRFCRCVSRPSFQQLIALALVAALLAPTSALARPLASGRQSPPPSLLTVAAGDMWRTLAAFINSAQDERRGMARRLAPERPLPERIAPEQPPTKAERATRVARLETNARGRLELEVGQLTMLVATPLDAEGNAVHGLVAEWQSSDPQVVWVTPDGEAEARQPGVARLTAVLDHHRVTVPVQVAPRRAAQPQTEPQSARQRRLPNDAAGVRFINARSSPGDEAHFAGAALRAGGAKMMRAAPAQTSGTGGPLPVGEVPSLYTPENSVGLPPGRTEPGAVVPPAAFSGTETPLSANYTAGVPLMSLPGRGLDLNLGLTYNSRLWHKSASGGTTYLTYDVDAGWPGPGFRFRFPQLEQHGSPGSYTYSLSDPDGTRHQMVAAGTNLYETVDGTFIRLTSVDPLGVNYPDGTRVRFGAANGPRLYPTRIRSRNGNLLLINYVGGVGPRISSIQDTLGRYTRFHYDPSNNLVAITAPGYAGGADQQVARFYYEDLAINPSFTAATRAPASVRVLRFVYFPGTRAGYSFTYSTYGMAYRVRQKRSMTVDYMGLDRTGTVTYGGDGAADTIYDYPTGPSNLADAPQFTRRTDEWAGRTTGMSGSGEAPYHTFAVDQAQGRSTITAPDGSVSEARTIVAAGQWNDGLVSEVAVKQGSTVMAKTTMVWEHDGANRNHRPQKISATDEVNQTRSTAFGYTSFNNVAVAREYDFNGTTELRRTETTYETRAQYTDRRLLHLPTSVKVFAGGAGAPISRVDFSYDTAGANLTARPDIIVHDETYNPASTGYIAATDSRGNVTSVTKYADAAAGGGQITDTMTYDIAGNVIIQTADCCQQKRYTYTKAFEYAYATEVARGNAGQLSTSANYDFNTGAVRSTTDENNETATHHYYPETMRFYRTDRPDGGYTYNEYGDGLYQNGDPQRMHSYIYTTTKLDAAGREVLNDRYVDGRGAAARTFASYATSGPDPVTTDINYDTMGRAVNFSNPYTSAGVGSPINPSDLWGKRSYDALGRTASMTMPDNTVMNSSYAGKITTVTDAAGKSRRQVRDALGRVVRVDEPNAAGSLGTVDAPAQPTAYSYDALNNLVRVQQGVQNRYFKYDSLSRLTHERQPEQGAPHTAADPLTGNSNWSRRMVYNAQSLIVDQWDARDWRTNYSYDGLNRITRIDYTDGSVTPTVTYTYDQARPGYDNQGQLTQVETAAIGATPATRQVYDYNRMGQVARQQQTIAFSTYTLSYSYNEAGQLERETYPSGRVVKYDHDNAGRLSGVADVTNAASPRTYSTNFAYSEHNALTSESWGNGAVHTISYNTRLQPTQIKLTVGGAEKQRFDYRYGQVNLSTGAVDAAKNTGQVGRTDGFIDGAKQWEQRYAYDSLDRLDIAAEHRGDTSALTYRADYDHDRYGNRLQSGGQNLNLAYTPVVAADISTATNRFTSNTSYDAAGNVTADAKFRSMQYQYDAAGRMKWAALLDNTAQSTAVYDGLGRRVQTAVGAAVRHLVYDIYGRMVAEYEPGGGGWKRDHIYRGSGLLVSEEVGGTRRYVLDDRQGSTRAVLDGSAAVVARHDYLPFGEEIGAGTGLRTTQQGFGALHNLRQRYAGTEQDDGTGLEHTQWRKMEAKAGRWTSPDPYTGSMRVADPQSFNRYAYVGNDPVNRSDPSGLEQQYPELYNEPVENYGGGGDIGYGFFAYYTPFDARRERMIPIIVLPGPPTYSLPPIINPGYTPPQDTNRDAGIIERGVEAALDFLKYGCFVQDKN